MDWTAFFAQWFPSIIVTLGFGLFWRRLAKDDEKEKARKKCETLLIKCVVASLALGEATAFAIRDGKCNGEMKVALDYAKQVKHEQKDFLTEQGVDNLY